eukprot:CAMPEP_0115552848 /NCGR_PEP_ID=MMETSP0271-20121206/96456_1 /TAXON_ID=71861 /ORGANISM="Scrippsiella trochoidea, Strain CCMP3099" /LENGTH=30 /DNA_ID= /DNA_START= /DNA_END= /DNA_ORIENTATION=
MTTTMEDTAATDTPRHACAASVCIDMATSH